MNKSIHFINTDPKLLKGSINLKVKTHKMYLKTISEQLDVLNIYDNKSNSNDIIHPFFSNE